MNYRDVIHVARAFAEDYALCHDMPEVSNAAKMNWRVNNKEGDEWIECVADVQPRGQMSALVSRLYVEVKFYQRSSGLYYANVRMSYTHHSGGTNGHNDDFRVVTEKALLSDKLSYAGFIHAGLELLSDNERRAAKKE